MSKSEKDIQALRAEQEDMVLRRVLFWLGAAVVLEALVLVGNRYFFHYMSTELWMLEPLMKFFTALQYVGLILAAACAVWARVARKKDAKRGVVRIILAVFFAVLALASFLFLRAGAPSAPVLLVSIPAGIGLIMIYYLYQKEFFVNALMCGVGILGLWIIRAGYGKHAALYYAYAICAILLVAAIVLLAAQIRAKRGMLAFAGRRVLAFKPDASYMTIWITAGLVVAALILALAFGIQIAYYAILVLVIWLFALAVYFTSRLM